MKKLKGEYRVATQFSFWRVWGGNIEWLLNSPFKKFEVGNNKLLSKFPLEKFWGWNIGWLLDSPFKEFWRWNIGRSPNFPLEKFVWQVSNGYSIFPSRNLRGEYLAIALYSSISLWNHPWFSPQKVSRGGDRGRPLDSPFEEFEGGVLNNRLIFLSKR